MTSIKQQLFDATREGRVEEVGALLRDNSELNVNSGDEDGWTALHYASRFDHVGVIQLLLAHPAINVNVQDHFGRTPLLFGCLNGHGSAVRVLLKDHRVDVTLTDFTGHTPLWWASGYGGIELVEWLLASGRDLGDLNTKRKVYTVLEIARKDNTPEVSALLEKFIAHPTLTRHELRLKLG